MIHDVMGGHERVRLAADGPAPDANAEAGTGPLGSLPRRAPRTPARTGAAAGRPDLSVLQRVLKGLERLDLRPSRTVVQTAEINQVNIGMRQGFGSEVGRKALAREQEQLRLARGRVSR
jgi:hypothetical protein